ncbi:MAG: RNA methyltransferase [Deltaproteobacteria bacterium]|nr:RNA methyltransferase [Deltaproteobacteria bacterium]
MGIFEISRDHRKWVRGLHRKKTREKEGLFIAEGFNALEAAVRTTHHPIVEVMTDGDHHERVVDILPDDLPVFECSGSIMEEISTEKTPQGVMIICRRGKFDFQALEGALPDTLLYLDRVSDPGNLGTIVRTAAWFGIGQLVLSPSCVDPFNTKAIRASAGAIFTTEIYQSVDPNQIRGFAERMGYRMVAMVPRGGGSPGKLKKTGKKIVMLGQEADGLSEELKGCADQLVSIPGRGEIESLNLSVAAAIILYEIAK